MTSAALHNQQCMHCCLRRAKIRWQSSCVIQTLQSMGSLKLLHKLGTCAKAISQIADRKDSNVLAILRGAA